MPRNLIAASTLFLLLGCAANVGPARNRVFGKVTWGGEPIPAGLVIFEPDASKGNDGPQGSATIKDGRFDTAAAGGKGAVSGPNIVKVFGYDGKTVTEDSPSGKPLFTPFTLHLDLPAKESKHSFDVPKS